MFFTKVLNITAVMFTVLLVTACSDNKVSMVKSGTLEFDKSLTVGQAIDNYKYFTKTTWETLTTENKKQVVQVSGKVDLLKSRKEKTDLWADAKTAELLFQFVVNQDKTFELSWCGVRVETDSGKKIEPQQQANLLLCIKVLKGIYNNSPDI